MVIKRHPSSQALCLGSTTCDGGTKKVVDARHKAWHDGVKWRGTPGGGAGSCLDHRQPATIGRNPEHSRRSTKPKPDTCGLVPGIHDFLCSSTASRGSQAQGLG